MNLLATAIEVYRAPTPDGYQDIRMLRRGEPLASEAFPDLRLTVDDILA